MSATPGLRHIGISTNGTRLAPLARRLRHAGAATVNISLDALDPAVYRRITGADVEAVLAGIRAAAVAQFARVKLNCVLLRGINEQELWPLVGFAAKHDLPVRFIELMPVTANDALIERSFLPISEAMRLIAERDELIPQHGDPLGWGPTRYYRLKRTGVLVGFIGALTTPRFCETCNKLRLTADGKLRPCLGDNGEYDLRQVLRCGADDEALRARFSEALRAKPRAHSFCREYLPNRPMTAIGG